MSSDGELDEDANELTPFYKPGYAQAWSSIKLVEGMSLWFHNSTKQLIEN